jgi:hypothetical protein
MHGFGFMGCKEVLNHWNQNLQRFFHRPNESGHEEDFEIAMNLKEVAILKNGPMDHRHSLDMAAFMAAVPATPMRPSVTIGLDLRPWL